MPHETILSSKVPPTFHGKSLLEYLCGRFPYQDHETWEDLIRRGKVRVNGQKSSPIQPVHKGNVVSYASALREPPIDPTIVLVHEEDVFLAASKSGNLPCHADGQYVTHTFVHLLKEKLEAAGYHGFLGLAHRIDRETSGLLLVAKTLEALQRLTGAFERGEVEKRYLAWVRGTVKEEAFERRDPIGRDPGSSLSIRRKALPEGTEGALAARTLFEVVERREDRTLVLCRPLTGRTHQIRVHLEAAGYPVVGDKLYGRKDEDYLDFIHRSKRGEPFDAAKKVGASRQLLHASRLTFAHPVTGEKVSYEAPLPEDMK